MPNVLFALVLVIFALTVSPSVAESQASQRILETSQSPTDIDRSSPNWAANVCRGKTAFTPGGSRYEWTPVIPGNGQYGSLEAASGWALNPHVSGDDVPFTHPFGKVDFDYFLLPDAGMNALLAPNNAKIPSDSTDPDALSAKSEADALKLTIGSAGLLGVEQDVGLIPEAYRPRKGMGDRVAVFGRWIIDCGHDNWHSEIHPPLLTVVARPDNSANTTHVDIVANPYLVDQEFAHGGFLDQLMHDLALVFSPLPLIPFTDRVRAQAGFLPPSRGLQYFTFRIRPPGPAPSADHSLYVRLHLTARTGVVVQPFWVDKETIAVVGLFADSLTLFPVTGRKDWDVSGDELTGLDKNVGMAWNAMLVQVGAGLGDFIKGAVLAQGIRANLYDTPAPPDLTNAPVREGWAGTKSLNSNPITLNNDQPFPLIGWMEVQWRVPPRVMTILPPAEWRVTARHLDELHEMGNRSMLVRTLAASALVADVAPTSGDSIDGAWRYRIQAVPGQPGETGVLWLRTNGTLVQGAMAARETKVRDILTGNLLENSQLLRLVRTNSRGVVQQMTLTLRRPILSGLIEGTRQTMELRRP